MPQLIDSDNRHRSNGTVPDEGAKSSPPGQQPERRSSQSSSQSYQPTRPSRLSRVTTNNIPESPNKQQPPLPAHLLSRSQGERPVRRLDTLDSNNLDRMHSIYGITDLSLGSGATPESASSSTAASSAALEKLNKSRFKMVTSMAAHYTETELRMGLRTLPASQTQVRLELFRHQIREKLLDQTEIAQKLLEEDYAGLTRMGEIRAAMRECDNLAAACDCQLRLEEHEPDNYRVIDNLFGFTIVDYIENRARQLHQHPSCKEVTDKLVLANVWKGLDEFYRDKLGAWDSSRRRCQEVKEFLADWVNMSQQPAYLNKLDMELVRVQREANKRRAKGEHVDSSGVENRSLKRITTFTTNLLRSNPGRSTK